MGAFLMGKSSTLTARSTKEAEKLASAPWGRLVLLVICPMMVQIIAYINTELQGSFVAMIEEFVRDGFLHVIIHRVWGPYFFGTSTAWKILGVYAGVEILLMKILPGPIVKGPETIHHNRPVYKDNGFLAFVVSVLLFWVCSVPLDLFSPTILHDNLIALLGAMNASSLLFCLFLYFKGCFFPDTEDVLFRGSFIADYYWGVELYPTILGVQVKQFTNCRFGMMSWPIIILSYAAKQEELYGAVADGMWSSVILQFIYVGTFFYYERGYYYTMDIQHDRAGFYLCWGCLLWVPCVYTSSAMFLVYHPYQLGTAVCVGLVLLGIAGFLQKTHANRQRLNVRANDGNYRLFFWSPENARIIRAKYTTERGEQKESILLADGWWRVAAHSHYWVRFGVPCAGVCPASLLISCPTSMWCSSPLCFVIAPLVMTFVAVPSTASIGTSTRDLFPTRFSLASISERHL